MFRRLWVQIPAPYPGWTFSTFICCKNCNVCLKKTKINKESPAMAHLKNVNYGKGKNVVSNYLQCLLNFDSDCQDKSRIILIEQIVFLIHLFYSSIKWLLTEKLLQSNHFQRVKPASFCFILIYSNNLQNITVDLSGIRVRIVTVDGEHADNSTTATTQSVIKSKVALINRLALLASIFKGCC